MTPSEEKAYIEGERAVARNVLQFALRLVRENGGKTDGGEAVKVLSETEAALKRLCDEHEIEVPENLHPADVIEKRIGRHIAALMDENAELSVCPVCSELSCECTETMDGLQARNEELFNQAREARKTNETLNKLTKLQSVRLLQLVDECRRLAKLAEMADYSAPTLCGTAAGTLEADLDATKRRLEVVTKERDELSEKLVVYQACADRDEARIEHAEKEARALKSELATVKKERDEAKAHHTYLTDAIDESMAKENALSAELSARRASDEDVRACARFAANMVRGSSEAERLLACDWLKKEGGS